MPARRRTAGRVAHNILMTEGSLRCKAFMNEGLACHLHMTLEGLTDYMRNP